MHLELFVLIGSVFSPLAGAIAFLITYEEYRKHKFEGGSLWKPSLQAACFTFGVFFLLSLVLGYLLRFAV